FVLEAQQGKTPRWILDIRGGEKRREPRSGRGSVLRDTIGDRLVSRRQPMTHRRPAPCERDARAQLDESRCALSGWPAHREDAAYNIVVSGGTSARPVPPGRPQ